MYMHHNNNNYFPLNLLLEIQMIVVYANMLIVLLHCDIHVYLCIFLTWSRITECVCTDVIMCTGIQFYILVIVYMYRVFSLNNESLVYDSVFKFDLFVFFCEGTKTMFQCWKSWVCLYCIDWRLVILQARSPLTCIMHDCSCLTTCRVHNVLCVCVCSLAGLVVSFLVSITKRMCGKV